MVVLVAFALGYVAGSIPWAWLAGRAFGVDLRRSGSGNVGTSNVWHEASKPAAVAVFWLDVAKALAAVWIGSRWGEGGRVAAAWGAIAGHAWPVWLGFVGGRALAVALTAGMVIAPYATLAVLVGLGVGLFTRHLAVAWPLLVPIYPLLAWWWDGADAAVFAAGVGAITLVRRLVGSPLLERRPLRRAWWARLLYDREPEETGSD